MSENRQLIHNESLTSICGLLTAYGLKNKRVDPAEASTITMASVISFVSDQVFGNVCISATRGVLEDTRNAGHACSEDWVGELSNQLLGRLKIRLLPYDVQLILSTPVVLTGSGLTFLSRSGVEEVWFGTGDGKLGLHIAPHDRGAILLEYRADHDRSATEGSITLFLTTMELDDGESHYFGRR